MHYRGDYRVPDEAETWLGKCLCLVWGALFAPALLADWHDRVYNEYLSGAGAGLAQMLVIAFWGTFVVCEVEGVTACREWVLAGMLVPALLLQVLIGASRSRVPVWNRVEEYMFPPSSLPQPVEEEEAKAFAQHRMPPLCCADEDMRIECTCLHTGDVCGIPRGSLYVKIVFFPAPRKWKQWLMEDVFYLYLPFLWVLSLLCLMLAIPLGDALRCLFLALLLVGAFSLLRQVECRAYPSPRRNEWLEGGMVAMGWALFLSGAGLLAYVIFYHLW